MIKGFDQQTQPLSEYEENVLLPVILQGLKDQARQEERSNQPNDSYAVECCRVQDRRSAMP